MRNRADITIILLFNRQGFRADFAKGQAADSTAPFVQENIDAEASLADAVKAVVDKSISEGIKKLAPRTLIVATDVWSQVISLPRISLGGIESDELDAALRFEAETLSGIEIDDLSLAHSTIGSVGDFEQFWVNVVRQSELEEINSYLEKLGCREINLAHPAGFSNNGNEKLDGISAEYWDDLVYLLTHNGTQLSKVKQSTPQPAEGCNRLLIATSREVDSDNLPDESVVLDDSESIVRWMSQVAAANESRVEKSVAPMLRKSKPRSGTPFRHFVSALLALAVVAFCFWHWSFITQNKQELIDEIARVKQPAQSKKDFDSQIIKIFQDRSEIESEFQKLDEEQKRIEFFLNNQNDRIAKLLNLLIQLRTPDLVIQRIDGTEDGLQISGFSINGESAQALAKRLRTEVQPLGWLVNPAKQKGQEKLTTGGPWEFKIVLTDVGPSSSRELDRTGDLRNLR